jgi:hypothetical protein
MTKPITVALPHQLGAQEAKRRMQSRIGQLRDHIPGGAQVESSWTGDRMHLSVRAMGQDVRAHIDVEEKLVRLELQLPPALSFLAGQVEGLIRRRGAELLEDKSGKDR